MKIRQKNLTFQKDQTIFIELMIDKTFRASFYLKKKGQTMLQKTKETNHV